MHKASNGESVCHCNSHLPKTSENKVSVSLAPVGFTHAAFPFSINYVLWSHTWQCTVQREMQQGSGDCVKDIMRNRYRMQPLYIIQMKGKPHTREMPPVIAKTGKTMECAWRNLKCRIVPLDSQLYNMQVRMFSPVKTQL